jgi:hypothetical protein
VAFVTRDEGISANKRRVATKMRSLATNLPERVAIQVRRVAAELEVEADTLDSGRDCAGRRF